MTIKKRTIEELEVKCPFCGSDLHFATDSFDNGEDRLWVMYHCVNCEGKFEVTYRDILIAETITDVNENILESIYN